MVVCSLITTLRKSQLCIWVCSNCFICFALLIYCVVLRLCGGVYPQYILNKAAQLDDEHEMDGSKFYPFYDKILNYWFPPADGFDVSPQWTIPNYGSPTNCTITYVVEIHQHPLLLVEVMPPSDFHLDLGRVAAINQVIQRLDEIGPTNQQWDQLYAISAIGKRWRGCYTLRGSDSTDGQFVPGIADINSLRSGNAQCWNPDITSDASFVALQNIVNTIKGYILDNPVS
jgi:hypothetical protein